MKNKYPYFDCGQDVWDLMMKPFNEKGKGQMANQCAHHMLPVRKVSDGWLLTRHDYMGKEQIMHIAFDGTLTYRYEGEL